VDHAHYDTQQRSWKHAPVMEKYFQPK